MYLGSGATWLECSLRELTPDCARLPTLLHREDRPVPVGTARLLRFLLVLAVLFLPSILEPPSSSCLLPQSSDDLARDNLRASSRIISSDRQGENCTSTSMVCRQNKNGVRLLFKAR